MSFTYTNNSSLGREAEYLLSCTQLLVWTTRAQKHIVTPRVCPDSTTNYNIIIKAIHLGP